MEFGDFIRIYGPMGIGWVVAGYLMKFIMDRYDKDIDAKVKLATVLESLLDKLESKNGPR